MEPTYPLMSWAQIKLKEVISHEGVSTLHLAELQPAEGSRVTVKTVAQIKGSHDEREHEKMLRWEATVMSQLHHPNIVALHGLIPPSTPNDVAALVMEYVPNGNLADALQDARANELLPWRSRVVIALQVAQAMHYMHSVGIVHLDLNSSNLFLDMRDPTKPVCKIGDFKWATEYEPKLCTGPGMPQQYGTVGYHYTATEDDMPRTVTKWEDVHSFGVLMWELLTGNRTGFEMQKVAKNDQKLHSLVPEWCYPRWSRLMEYCRKYMEAPRRPAFVEVALKLRGMLADFPAPATSRSVASQEECPIPPTRGKYCLLLKPGTNTTPVPPKRANSR